MNLKELARMRGTNLKKVAEKIGAPPSTLYAIASGDTRFDNVGITTFVRIADALDMSTEELYGSLTRTDYAFTVLDDPGRDELLRLWDNLDARGREAVLAVARSLSPQGSGVSEGVA